MPQLNPSPWFSIFVASWTILILISLLKTSKSQTPNSPANKQFKLAHSPWTWPWP
uniref:ATP synthase complex subunit 8 n=1 Tax=Crinia signifera TaxID=326986 RepID=S4V0H0_CRISI|nr:ATP synthase F0 subunit 8 [Crinia signifera]